MHALLFFSAIILVSHAQADTFEGFDNVESLNEGSCALAYPEGNVVKNFINDFKPEGGFYLPFSSKLESILLAKGILGRDVTSDDDPRFYCPRLHWNTSIDGKVDVGYFHGFHNSTAFLTCERLDEFGNMHECKIENKGQLLFTNTIYWTLTDQETYIVIVICIENKNKMWNVLSTKPKLEDDVAAKIGAHVQSLGFDANKFNVVDYSLC